MTTLTFDNHLFVKNLIKQGFKENQAEAIADGLKASREFDLNQLVTKDYLKAELSGLEIRLIKWITWGGIILFTTIISSACTLYYFLKPFIKIIQ